MTTPTETPTPLAARAVRRALAKRESASAMEVRQLLDAGLTLMERNGCGAAPRVGDIVRAAGLSNQAFYRHFAGRNELVAAVAEAGAHRLVSYAAHQMSKAAEPEEQIRRWIAAVLSQAGNRKVAEQTRAVLWNLRQLPRSADDRAPHDAGASGLLVVPLTAMGSADPERDAAAIGDLVFGRLDHHLWGPPPVPADLEHVTNFCLAGIQADSTRGPSPATEPSRGPQ